MAKSAVQGRGFLQLLNTLTRRGVLLESRAANGAQSQSSGPRTAEGGGYRKAILRTASYVSRLCGSDGESLCRIRSGATIAPCHREHWKILPASIFWPEMRAFRTRHNSVKTLPSAAKPVYEAGKTEAVKCPFVDLGAEIDSAGPENAGDLPVTAFIVADLVRPLRYERRAWSRRKRAVRAFMPIKLMNLHDVPPS
jgi:hypothetical protein